MAPFPGSRVTPDDPRYPTLIRGFNQRWVGHPEYVEVVGDASQIVGVIQRCVDEGLRPTVRSGGHCYEGWVSLNDGVILDVSSMHAAGKDPGTGWYFLESGLYELGRLQPALPAIWRHPPGGLVLFGGSRRPHLRRGLRPPVAPPRPDRGLAPRRRSGLCGQGPPGPSRPGYPGLADPGRAGPLLGVTDRPKFPPCDYLKIPLSS